MVKIMYYINNFFIFSIFGFIFESIISIIFNHKFNSGFLIGPYTPIYGLGIIIIILINKYLDKKKLTKFKKVVLTIIINTTLLTLIELIGGYLIKWIFNKSLWNYTSLPLHIGKYISLEISILWSIMSLIFLYYIKPFSDCLITKIPKLITILFVLN